jgi:hypothetical protein
MVSIKSKIFIYLVKVVTYVMIFITPLLARQVPIETWLKWHQNLPKRYKNYRIQTMFPVVNTMISTPKYKLNCFHKAHLWMILGKIFTFKTHLMLGVNTQNNSAHAWLGSQNIFLSGFEESVQHYHIIWGDTHEIYHQS